jgi:hypothetical protein
MRARIKICDTIGADGSRFGVGVGQQCENEAIWHLSFCDLCDDCYKILSLHRSRRGWGKRRRGWEEGDV